MSFDTTSTKSIIQTIQVMRRQEKNGYQVSDYLSDLSSVIDASCRFAMVQWANQVATLLDYQNETMFITMNILDRFISTPIGRQEILIDRDQFQLAFISALYMSVKINEPIVLDLQTVSSFSQGRHTPEAITAMELKILNSINWQVNPPTPHSFVRMILDLLSSNNNNVEQYEIETIASQTIKQIESLFGNYRFYTDESSSIALACILNVLEGIVGGNDYKLYKEIERIIGKILNIDAASSCYIQDLRCSIRRENIPSGIKNHNDKQNNKGNTPTTSIAKGNSSRVNNKGNDNNYVQRSPRTVIV